MVFIGIVLIAIFLYIRDFKIPALLIFFFFVTSGFNLVPETMTKFAFISKGSDYAFFILIGIILIDSLLYRGYFNRDNFTKYLIVFALFLTICIFYNKYSLKLGWSDILRTSRYQFFWIAYFLFRHIPKGTLETLLKYLFFVTIVTASLYLLQIVLDETILLEGMIARVRFLGMTIPRFYNQPDMLFFFTFMALYHNPLKGFLKYLSMIILTAALLGAFHRSLIGCFLFCLLLGFIIKLPYLKRVYFTIGASIVLLFAVVFWGYKFVHSKTYVDIGNVISGNFSVDDFDMRSLGDATFTFRVLHLVERNQYILDHRRAMFLGAGLMPENSKLVEKMFDFRIGLVEELTGNVVQLDTGDISYSNLILRLGYLGTFLYLVLIFYFIIFFYKKRDNRYGLFSFLYLILTIGDAWFSSNLLYPFTFLLPLISYHIIKKTESETVVNEN